MQNQLKIFGALTLTLTVAGCNSFGGPVADVGLASLGGAAGYELSGDKIGGAAVGAAAGYITSKVVESNREAAISEAEKRGFNRALNQAVKQQYWIIQNAQRSSESSSSRLIPVQIPAQSSNGVITNPTTEYIRVK